MLTSLRNAVHHYITFHPCRWCVRYGGSGQRKAIPKPTLDASIQEKYAYQLSICPDCIERLKVVLL